MTLLFVCLRTRGLPAFQGFLNVLRMTFHGWLADEILDSTIKIGGMCNNIEHSVVVRDILNDMYETKLQSEHPRYRPIYLAENENPYIPPFPKGQGHRHDINGKQNVPFFDGRRQTRSEHQRRRHEYTSVQNSDLTRNVKTADEVPLVEHVPENLRDLQKAFDKESSTTQKSISILKQEEITIKALLQHNLRVQQDLLSRQQALQDIQDKMRELNKTATQLYKPEPDVHISRKRLKHLQQVPWTGKD